MKIFLACLLLLGGAAYGQWTKVPVSTTASLRGLSVVSENIVWASGTGGTVIRTVDSGKHWALITVPGAEQLDFRGIRAFDGSTAVIISSGPAEKGQARIYRTSDGGATWSQVFEEKRAGVFFDAVAFWDRKHGIVLSDPVDGRFALFTTDNSGATWKQVPPSALPPALPNEGAFAASNSCLAVQGERNVWFATGGAQVARVFRSNDRGRTWAVSETPMRPQNASSGIFSLAFQDAKNGIAVGGDYEHPETSDLPSVLVTRDGGKSYQLGAPTNPAGLYLSSVAILPCSPKVSDRKKSLVAAGIKGLYYLPHLGNGSWVREGEANINAVGCNAHHTWAVGTQGTVLARSAVAQEV